MPTYDWPVIQHRSGESIESLLATLLCLEFSDARQINPSQGDQGIDVIRESPEGIEVWQVKGFTSPLTSGQFGQVKNSWSRFWKEHVSSGPQTIVGYHLVSPWTPTEERITAFRTLTREASFPCDWKGDAYISGLADKYPATLHRFIHGEGALDSFISQKALLAASPVERGSTITMLDAVQVRQAALDEIRDTVSDNYRIEHGTRTHTGKGNPPLPDPDDGAVFHRMQYLGNNRWTYESLVPRSPGSAKAEPITHNIKFLDDPGSPGFLAVKEWAEWGTPFEGARAIMTTRGGPFAGEHEDESTISFIATGQQDAPPLFLRCVRVDGSTRWRMRLAIATRTVGAQTGWMRLVAETPEAALRFEMNLKGPGELQANALLGRVDGKEPEAVADEAKRILEIEENDVLSVEVSGGATVLKGRNVVLPTALKGLVLQVAEGLLSLQRHTSDHLLMPNIEEVTDEQLQMLELLVGIYGGTAYVRTWQRASLTINDNVESAEEMKKRLAQLRDGTHRIAFAEAPRFELGGVSYQIDHPIVTTRHSAQASAETDLAGIQPGQTITVVPQEDDGITTAMLADWVPGSDIWSGQP